MRVWRLSRKHSLRRTAQHALRERRTVGTWAAWRQSAGAWLRRLDWWPPLGVALLIHVPFVWGLFGEDVPTWLGTAWLVSATLVGLGVALVVFLLQAASSQSLSSQATYRAVLAHTRIVWPTTFALVFLVATGALERFGASPTVSLRPTPWANTWALVVFALQILAFGVAFARTLEVISPAGVGRVLRATFGDSMNRGVQANLVRRLMLEDLHALCQPHVGYGAGLARGQAVIGGRAGWLADVDRQLPGALNSLGLGDAVTLTLLPGRTVTEGDSLAKLDGAHGYWLERMIHKAVVIRRGGPPDSAVPVFNDVLDVARRALTSGSHDGFRQAIQLVVDCLIQLPDTYGRWGFAYVPENVSEFGTRTPEDDILLGLVSLNDEAFRSDRDEMAVLLPQLAGGLVEAGLEKDAFLLVEQGTSLWRHQAGAASTIVNPRLQQRVRDLIERLGAQAIMLHQHGLEDPDNPLERRLAALPGLPFLFRHQVEVMKLYVERDEDEQFVEAWRHWAEWGRHWEPEHDVEEIELQITVESANGGRAESRAMDSARQLLEAKRSLVGERARLIFHLGSWLLEQRQRDKLPADRWLALVPRLVGSTTNTKAVVSAFRSFWTKREERPLRTWQLNAWDGSPGTQPADPGQSAGLWGAVLLLRTIDPNADANELDLGPTAPQLAPILMEEIDRLTPDVARWEDAVGGQLTARAEAARIALNEAVRRAHEWAEQRLAEAPIDDARVTTFADRQLQLYTKGDYVRQRLVLAGAVDLVDPTPSDNPTPGVLCVKRPFVDIEGPDVLIGIDQFAQRLVEHQLQNAYTALADLASPMEGQAAEAAIQAITELRSAGHKPDAVLLPHDRHIAVLLSGHPEWQWNTEFIRENPQIAATLGGVPVYEPGPSEATALIVCELGASVRRVEHHAKNAPPISVRVTPIQIERASELLAIGGQVPGVDPDDRNAQQNALVSGYVEVHVDMTAEWKAPDNGKVAARRIELPHKGERRRTETRTNP